MIVFWRIALMAAAFEGRCFEVSFDTTLAQIRTIPIKIVSFRNDQTTKAAWLVGLKANVDLTDI